MSEHCGSSECPWCNPPGIEFDRIAAKRERDALLARAEKAERERGEMAALLRKALPYLADLKAFIAAERGGKEAT